MFITHSSYDDDIIPDKVKTLILDYLTNQWFLILWKIPEFNLIKNVTGSAGIAVRFPES